MILRPDQSVNDLRVMTEAFAEQTIITPIADTGAKEVQTVLCPAVAGASQADYIVFLNKAGVSFAAWIDIDANGTAPTGAAYVAATHKIKISVATGDTAPQFATKMKANIEADGSFAGIVISINSATLSFTQTLMGDVAAMVRHNANDSGNGSFVIATLTNGAASNLQNKYFLINSPTVNYYAWANVNNEGVDPTPGGTAIPMAIPTGSSVSSVASILYTTMLNHVAFDAKLDTITNVVEVVSAVVGEAVNASAGNIGFTVKIGHQGSSRIFDAEMSPSLLSNSPSTITALS